MKRVNSQPREMPARKIPAWLRWLIALAGFHGLVVGAHAAEVIQKEGAVEVTKAGATLPATVGIALAVRDRLGTGESSRAVLKMSAGWNARVDEETYVEITATGLNPLDRQSLKLEVGRAFLYSRESKGEWKLQTRGGELKANGTQVLVQAFADGRTFVQVIEGNVDLANALGAVQLASGEAAESTPATAPRKTAVIETRNLLQWALYYPAVLEPDELGLSAGERSAVADSLTAYGQGDLLEALARYPRGFDPLSPGGKLYRAAVLLATGQVDAARRIVQDVSADHPGRRALERMLAAVLAVELTAASTATTASGALAESYYQQSRRQLDDARTQARRATELAPRSGYAWTRLADLEFSFGRTRAAWIALERGLTLTPRNAQAHALRGFLLSAANRIDEARTAFEQAIQLDGALGQAWLGLGLTKIRQGQLAAGRSDLRTAATVEPTRAFFYSYHAKALGLSGDDELARKDLALARQFDPADPTPWLYAALQLQQENRPNDAIGELGESLRLNDSRQVYRSQFLLDEDRAVRSSNLATIFQKNGMTDLAVRQATRAVESDYANASSHLFLANSFNALRDPRQLSLRYESAWFNEQLLAHLLAPVGGGPLSQYVSQQEYSKLFEADGVGGNVITEARDDGTFVALASLFGTKGNLSGGLDFSYRRDAETRPNQDNAIREFSGQLKYQPTPDDILYGLVQGRGQKNGDLLENYANLPGNPGLRFEEKQQPGLALLGANHRWAPGVHTLVLGGRLAAEQGLVVPDYAPALLLRDARFLQPDFLRPASGGGLEYTAAELRNASVPPVATAANGSLVLSADFQRALAPFLGRFPVTGVDFITDRRSNLSTRRKFEIYSGELLHLWQRRRNTLLLGGRWQGGTFDTDARLEIANPALVPFTTSPAVLQNVAADFARRSIYAYDFFQVLPQLTLIAGGSWDRVERPDNFRSPPVNDRTVTTERTNGKAGFTLTPLDGLIVRGVYTEALGGVSFDESVRLEPVQLAGFNQAFRTVMPESLVGSVEAPVYRNKGLSVEGTGPARTWWSLSFNALSEHVERSVGGFEIVVAPIFPRGRAILPAGNRQVLDYRENVFTAGINQLIGAEFAVGANYRRTRATLHDTSPEIPIAFSPYADDTSRAELEELALNVNWNSPAGWFARADGRWTSQDLSGAAGGQIKTCPPGDHFWQFDVQLGHRFNRNQRELSVGLLNFTDRDYHLSPLAVTRDLPRERTFFVRCRFGF